MTAYVVLASLPDVCQVCTDGWVLTWQPGSTVAVVLPCPHCQGWPLVALPRTGER